MTDFIDRAKSGNAGVLYARAAAVKRNVLENSGAPGMFPELFQLDAGHNTGLEPFRGANDNVRRREGALGTSETPPARATFSEHG